MTKIEEKAPASGARWDRWQRLEDLHAKIRGAAYKSVLGSVDGDNARAHQLLDDLWPVVLERACATDGETGLSKELDKLEAVERGVTLARRTVGLVAKDLVFRCLDSVKAAASGNVSLEGLQAGESYGELASGGLSVEDLAIGKATADHVRRVVEENATPHGLEVFRVKAVGMTKEAEQLEAGLTAHQIKEGRKNLNQIRDVIRSQCGAAIAAISSAIGFKRFVANPTSAEAAGGLLLGGAGGGLLKVGLGVAGAVAALGTTAVTVKEVKPKPKPAAKIATPAPSAPSSATATAAANAVTTAVTTVKRQTDAAAAERRAAAAAERRRKAAAARRKRAAAKKRAQTAAVQRAPDTQTASLSTSSTSTSTTQSAPTSDPVRPMEPSPASQEFAP